MALPLWHVFAERLIVSGELVAETALRVGQGSAVADPVSPDLPVIKEGNTPFIPGSSLRGILRAHAERLVRALEPEWRGGRGACDPLSLDGCCVSRARMEALRQQVPPGIERATKIFADSCRICRLFGSPWLASRVRVMDLWPCGGQTVPCSTRDAVAIDRDRGTVKNKYDFQVVDKGAKFRLEVQAENLTRPEKGLLLLVLQELASGHLPVGGFRGRGLGRVKVCNLKVIRQGGDSRDELLQYLRSGEGREVSAKEEQEWIDSFLAEVGDA